MIGINHGLACLADTQEYFRKHWQPRDPYEREEFNRDLTMLIHAIYAEASKPFAEYMMKIVSTIPTPPFIIKKESDK